MAVGVLFLNVLPRCVLWTLGCGRNQYRLSEAIEGFIGSHIRGSRGQIRSQQHPLPLSSSGSCFPGVGIILSFTGSVVGSMGSVLKAH